MNNSMRLQFSTLKKKRVKRKMREELVLLVHGTSVRLIAINDFIRELNRIEVGTQIEGINPSVERRTDQLL